MSLDERSAVHGALADPIRLAIVDRLWLTDLTPSEVGKSLGLRSNLIAHHLEVLDRVGLIERKVSAKDQRRRYLSLKRDRLPGLHYGSALRADHVLFVCTRNAARSQWAAALWSARVGSPAESAGTQPATQVDPLAMKVAARHHLDLSTATPKGWEGVSIVPDLVITVCDRARESGGVPYEAPALHWSIPDPAAMGRISAYESAFSAIARRIDEIAPPTNAPR